jgi:hypothetical protein
MTSLKETIIGRTTSQKAYNACASGAKCFVVGAYDTFHGDTYYTSPTYIGPREGWRFKKPKPPTRCKYRIVVTPKDLWKQMKENL